MSNANPTFVSKLNAISAFFLISFILL